MTVKVSPQKASRILQHFFKGMPQPEIAQKCGINQATVSRYASKLKVDADSIGIVAASKEHGIMHEVDSLRSLAVELSKNKLTVEEAQEGVTILKIFESLGILPEEHRTLVKAIPKFKNHDFIPAIMKLDKLERETGKSYTELVAQFEDLSAQIVPLQQRKTDLEQESEKIRQHIKELKAAGQKEEKALHRIEKETAQKKLALKEEVERRMKETNLTLDKIKRLEPIIATLIKMGITEDNLELYIKEHQLLEERGIGWENIITIVEGMNDDS